MVPFRAGFPRQVVLAAVSLLASALIGCNPAINSLTVAPTGTQTLTAIGQTAQFTATNTSQTGSGQPESSNVTQSAVWTSSVPSVATVNSAGLVTAVGAGTTQITASYGGSTSSTTLTVNTTGTTGGSSSSGGGSSSSGGIPTTTPTTGNFVVIPTPNTAVTSFIGETTQFLAIGTLTGNGQPQNLTNSVTWVSSDPSVVTVSPTGLATTIGADLATNLVTITAIGTSSTAGVLTASSNLATNLQVNHVPYGDDIVIIPNGATLTYPGDTTQFIAIANPGTGGTQDVTSKVKWSSSDITVATINQNGLASAANINPTGNTTTITAELTTPAGNIVYGTSVLAYGSSNVNSVIPTLTVYKVGVGAGTISSTPAGLTCGVQTACTGSFPLNSTVTLTATPASGSSFAGWSSNCAPVANIPTECTVNMSTNTSVGAIFNTP